MENEFINNTSFIRYTHKSYEKTDFSSISEIVFIEDKQATKCLNSMKINSMSLKEKIHKNKLDHFLIKSLRHFSRK